MITTTQTPANKGEDLALGRQVDSFDEIHVPQALQGSSGEGGGGKLLGAII